MKRIILTMAAIAILFATTGTKEKEQDRPDLECGFLNPPSQARPHTWWHWMNGNITREGITADLEAMARVGIGGAQIFNIAGSHQNDIPPGPVDYLSTEWLDMVKHAASEAGRLGLELCIHNCAGWSTSGGPWVKPEHAMQALVSSEVKVDGGKRVKLKLPQPLIRNNYYRDIAIFAFPTPKDDNFRVKDWRKKAVQVGGRNGRQPDLTPLPAESAINLDAIVEISQFLSEDGILEWDVPEGNWTIFRLGHTPTGKTNHPSPKSGEGLEIDKLSREALDVHWREGIQPILDHLGPLAGKVLNNILIDSYEAALNHWTPKLREEFQKRRGYDPTPYLPALQGRLIGDGTTTARFLWDFRRTVADLFADNYYGYFADLCREHGMLSSVEPYSSAYEFLAVAAKVDIPMGEFWVDNADHFSLRIAASSGHTHGQNIIGAESFTARPEKGRWQNYPAKLRPVGDKVWTKGINRLILATFAHQPWLDKVPGMTMGHWGCHFDRNNTWWEPGREWIKYISRSQYLLQSGSFSGDVLCFAGEASPNGGVYRDDLKNAGYDYDACGTDIIAVLEVDNGDIVLPSDMRYRFLMLPNTPFQTPALARKIRELVNDGATILGPKPLYSPSLGGFPNSENEVREIGEEVWGKCDGITATSNSYGKGQVFSGISPVEVLSRLNVAPAVQIPADCPELAWIHRSTDDTDIFFLSNQSGKNVNTIAGFRAVGKNPELWDAVHGTIKSVTGWTVEGEHTNVPLNLMSDESVFIIFRHSGIPVLELPAEDNKVISEQISLKGPWNVKFQLNRGAPEEARFDSLISWSEHPDPGIRYFSGTATNSIQFDIPKSFLKKDQEVWLDLGEVAVIADVRLNGKNLGILWNKPFRIEVSKALRSGSNKLEIDVTNLWVNRLIGDEHYPDDCDWSRGNFLNCWPDWLINDQQRPVSSRITFTTWKHWNQNNQLLPSGLTGPVTLRCARLIPVRSSKIDEKTVKEWSEPYRNWYYYPDLVIQPDPGIKGFEDIKMTDVPTVFQIKGNDKWFMTFIGYDGKGYQSFIAESTDLVNWNNMRLAMGYGSEGEFDNGGVVLGAYLYEDYDIKAPRILKRKNDNYYSLYGAYPRQGGYELRPGYEGVALSEDGIKWKRAKNEPILSVYQEGCGTWEKDCIYQPWLLEYKDKYYNFYNAANGHIEQTGVALSDNLLDWERYGHNPVIPNGSEGSYNEKFSSDSKVFWDSDHWVSFFFGVGKGGAHIMVAFSRDLYNWTVDPEPIYKAGGNPSGIDGKYAHKISLVWNPANKTYYMFYCAVDKNKKRGVGLITSKPLDN